jgi:hypothetical protein
MSHHDAFIDFVLRLEAMRQKQELTPDGARRLLSNTESVGSSTEAETSKEAPTETTEAAKGTQATEGDRTPTATSVAKET